MDRTITGDVLRDMILSGAGALSAQKQEINELNVFPVPDGDTGTNMSLTINAAVAELRGLESCSAAHVAETAAAALLRGARGNSGVILSLLFRGFARSVRGKSELTGPDFADALSAGVEAAYKAVMKPTEGTILTVARMAAEAGRSFTKSESDPLKTLLIMHRAACEALDKTPDMLPVLRQAGVVDAGGKGFVCMLEGMISALRDNVIVEGDAGDGPLTRRADFAAFSMDDIEYAYCTEFIINLDPGGGANGDRLRAFLESSGDSLVFVEDEGFIKVHVHTNSPGRVLEEGIRLGMLSAIKIENMREQFERELRESGAEIPAPAAADEAGAAQELKRYGFVAVGAGEGLCAALRDLGADTVVEGGQTMNPSTEDILRAIERTPAQCVFVLPNNKNIIMAAEMAAPLSSREARVIPSKTIPQGISAMLSFDDQAAPEENEAAMGEAIQAVKTGQVTWAVRDSVIDGKRIKKGEILGLLENRVTYVERGVERAAQRLLSVMLTPESSFVTIFYGEGITSDEADRLADFVKKHSKMAEVTVIDGGQPVYHYILSVE